MKKFAAFDIDGTLIRWQLYHAMVDKLAKSGELGTDAEKKVDEARMIWKRREQPNAFKVYEKALIDVYEAAVPRLKVVAFDSMVQAVIDTYKNQVHTYTRDLIADLKKQGYMLLAISGSQQELVQEIAKHYQFDDCVGTRYGRQEDTFSGLEFMASHDKKAILQQLITKHKLSLEGSIAVGDSGSDASMLELVEQPIAFNPDRALLTIAQEKGWRIVIERKSIVYTLEKQGGQYVLDVRDM